MKTIIMLVIVYFIVTFLVEVLINVFDWCFSFAEWLAGKIKDTLEDIFGEEKK